MTALFAWSSAILSGCYTYKTVMNGHQRSQDYLEDLEVSRKNQDKVDLGMTCSYVRASSTKIIWSGKFFIPHLGYERSEICSDPSIVRDPGE